MPAEIHGEAAWPGVYAVERFMYTCSRGISPGVALLTIQPQVGEIASNGNLVLTDGIGGKITLYDCRLRKVTAYKDSSGDYLTLEIEDRRWRWGYGSVSGVYNTVDPTGAFFAPTNASAGPRLAPAKKYLPWSLQKPSDLCKILLDFMGEKGYTIRVPNDQLTPVNWDYTNPAQQLSLLAEDLGCVVVFDPISNLTSVVPLGFGAQLPDGHIEKDSQSLPKLGRPDSILLVGGPTRYQCRMQLQAVGLDWDGMLRPIDNLSYAPVQGRVQQRDEITPANVAVGNVFRLTINGITVSFTATAATVANVTAGLTAAVNANAQLAALKIRAADAGGIYIALRGHENGDSYTLLTAATGGTARLTDKIVAAAKKGSWDHAHPPFFGWSADGTIGVHETDRLTALEALQLAQKSVFKYYRVVNWDPDTGAHPLQVPGFGEILRREQIILQNEKVAQIVPTTQDDNVIDTFNAQTLTLDFYNGYPRGQPARCYGSYYWHPTGLLRINNENLNTEAHEVVRVEFQIDPERHLVVFSDFVFQMGGGRADADGPLPGKVKAADLVLETAILLRDPLYHQIVRAEEFLVFPGPKTGSAPMVIRHEDVQVNHVALYAANRQRGLDRVVNDIPDAKRRASFYLKAAARQFQVKDARDREYGELKAIRLDGAIAQVTWSMDGSGVTTQASRNTEHSLYVPNYPERAVIEYLSPAQRREQRRAIEKPAPRPEPSIGLAQ